MANWTTASAFAALMMTLAIACNRRTGDLGPSSDLSVQAGPKQDLGGVGDQPDEVDPVALLRSQVPEFSAPENLAIEPSAIPAGPAELAATSTKLRISGVPLIDEAPVLAFGQPFPTVALEGACERTDYDGERIMERQRIQLGPHGPVLSWTDVEGDGRVETVARYTYDAEGRVANVVLEDRSQPDPCDWRVSREELGYDDHGALVHHYIHEPGQTVRYAANDARLYDEDGRVRWIYHYSEHYGTAAVRVAWEGDRVVLVEHFDRSGQWSHALVGTWHGADHVRVDEFRNHGGSTWDHAKVFVRWEGTFVEALYLVGDIDEPTVLREIEYVADRKMTRFYNRDGNLSSVVTRGPDQSVTVEKPDEHGKLVVFGKQGWLEPGVYGTGDGPRHVVYRTNCPELEPTLPAFPDASKCPPVPEGRPVYGPDASDR